MAETIVLDPSAVATSRTAVDITPWLTEEGVDWGDSAIEAYLADGAIGASPVDYRLPNRQVVASVRLMDRGTVTFETIRRQLQAKVALIQREGGWISRVTAAGGTVFADVVNATLKLGGDWMQAHTTAGRRADVSAQLSMELLPDWYGSEITLDDKTETSALALTTVLKLSAADAVITGDYPARVRVVVDEDDGDTQLGLVWGFRSRYYDSATTAALTYQAEALTPLDTAAAAALTGASGGTAVTHSSLRTDWTAVCSTTILSGSAPMTHKGTYRVWARCYSTSTTPPDVRFVWRVGSLVNPIENGRKSIPSSSNFYWLDLGEIRLDPAPTGTHQWHGQVHAIGSAGGENVSVDAIHFVPVDDGYGVLRAPQILPTLTSYSATDSFTSTSLGGTLNGRVAPVGGTWATSGSATDFTFADPTAFTGSFNEHVKRSASGTRFAILGTATYTGVVVELQLGQHGAAVIARWADSSNYVYGRIGDSPNDLSVVKVVSGVETVLATMTPSVLTQKLSMMVLATGRATLTAYGTSGAAIGAVVANDSALATGGALATGKVGFSDIGAFGDHIYDEFRAATIPELDATLYANQSAEIRSDGVIRENSAGNVYTAAPHIGDLPRLPPSGLESRKVEIYIKASRGDFDTIPDTGIDDISAQVFYRPSWLLLS